MPSFARTIVGTATVTTVVASTAEATAAADNDARRGLSIFNDSTRIVLFKFGSGASSTSLTFKLAGAEYYEMPLPIFIGAVTCRLTAGTANLRVTELS